MKVAVQARIEGDLNSNGDGDMDGTEMYFEGRASIMCN